MTIKKTSMNYSSIFSKRVALIELAVVALLEHPSKECGTNTHTHAHGFVSYSTRCNSVRVWVFKTTSDSIEFLLLLPLLLLVVCYSSIESAFFSVARLHIHSVYVWFEEWNGMEWMGYTHEKYVYVYFVVHILQVNEQRHEIPLP